MSNDGWPVIAEKDKRASSGTNPSTASCREALGS